jgi:hypothetical protein
VAPKKEETKLKIDPLHKRMGKKKKKEHQPWSHPKEGPSPLH